MAGLDKLLPRQAVAEAPTASSPVAEEPLAGDDFEVDVDLVKRVASTIQLKGKPPAWLK